MSSQSNSEDQDEVKSADEVLARAGPDAALAVFMTKLTDIVQQLNSGVAATAQFRAQLSASVIQAALSFSDGEVRTASMSASPLVYSAFKKPPKSLLRLSQVNGPFVYQMHAIAERRIVGRLWHDGVDRYRVAMELLNHYAGRFLAPDEVTFEERRYFDTAAAGFDAIGFDESVLPTLRTYAPAFRRNWIITSSSNAGRAVSGNLFWHPVELPFLQAAAAIDAAAPTRRIVDQHIGYRDLYKGWYMVTRPLSIREDEISFYTEPYMPRDHNVLAWAQQHSDSFMRKIVDGLISDTTTRLSVKLSDMLVTVETRRAVSGLNYMSPDATLSALSTLASRPAALSGLSKIMVLMASPGTCRPQFLFEDSIIAPVALAVALSLFPVTVDTQETWADAWVIATTGLVSSLSTIPPTALTKSMFGGTADKIGVLNQTLAQWQVIMATSTNSRYKRIQPIVDVIMAGLAMAQTGAMAATAKWGTTTAQATSLLEKRALGDYMTYTENAGVSEWIGRLMSTAGGNFGTGSNISHSLAGVVPFIQEFLTQMSAILPVVSYDPRVVPVSPDALNSYLNMELLSAPGMPALPSAHTVTLVPVILTMAELISVVSMVMPNALYYAPQPVDVLHLGDIYRERWHYDFFAWRIVEEIKTRFDERMGAVISPTGEEIIAAFKSLRATMPGESLYLELFEGIPFERMRFAPFKTWGFGKSMAGVPLHPQLETALSSVVQVDKILNSHLHMVMVAPSFMFDPIGIRYAVLKARGFDPMAPEIWGLDYPAPATIQPARVFNSRLEFREWWHTQLSLGKDPWVELSYAACLFNFEISYTVVDVSSDISYVVPCPILDEGELTRIVVPFRAYRPGERPAAKAIIQPVQWYPFTSTLTNPFFDHIFHLEEVSRLVTPGSFTGVKYGNYFESTTFTFTQSNVATSV